MSRNGGYPCPQEYPLERRLGRNYTCNVAEILNAENKLRIAAKLGLHSSDYALVIVSFSDRGSIGQSLWLSYARQDEPVRKVVEGIWLQLSRDFSANDSPHPEITKVIVTNAFKDRPDQGQRWEDLYCG
ncbi:MAG: hypothetical protein RLZZ622_511 [Planctomycetota bacterium]|jgi:hypothetical protein